jgi:molybdenum cofactor guanylyltransferase
MNHIAGIILAGGHSRRMGTDKASLPFGPELLLQRIVRIVRQVTSPVIVVSQQGRALPALPHGIAIAHDKSPNRGPLEGLAAGLRAIQNSSPEVDALFITGCDTPLLTPAFINRMTELLDLPHDAAVPIQDNVPQPLAGVYRPKILPVVDQLLVDNRLSLRDLLDHLVVRFVPPDELRSVDPDLQSLRNLNTPADYHTALAAAGLAADNRFL